MTIAILTDIEGTTSSISFVKDVLFPYARRELPGFVREHAEEPAVRHWLGQVKLELGGEDFGDETLIGTLLDWIDSDRKHTALKALQGMVWKAGYRTAEFAAHVYPDAAQALLRWYEAGHDLFVYSSGSVPSQKLFFSHSSAGDLTRLFSGYFDTEIGNKREAESYRRILMSMQRAADEVMFLSDVVTELDAARAAGMRTVLLDRPEDYALPRLGDDANGHVRATSFDEIKP